MRDLQIAMQSYIVHPGTHAEARDPALEAQVLPSPTLEPDERLLIYRRQYLLRMEEALAMDYPGLKDHLGAREFRTLVARYVQAHPSTSFTLNRLGDRLPQVLRGFARDLATLELAITHVAEEEDSPTLDAAGLHELPLEAWEGATLTPVKALRLLQQDWPAHAFLRGDRPEIRRRRTYLVVWRRDWKVWRMELPRPAFLLLGRLCEGTPLARAMDETRARPERVFEWFSSWVAEGLFSRLDVAS